MKYKNIVKGTFLKRPNRFLSHIMLDETEVIAHVRNTGRCKELLVPGATVYLEPSDNPNRKTKFSLVSVEKGQRIINMDSQAPNKVLEEALEKGLAVEGFPFPLDNVQREYTYGDSRLDFLLTHGEEKTLVEVKGVTLERENAVFFPDAPTLRGVRHLNHLMKALDDGYHATVCFIVKVENVTHFSPNHLAQPEFGETLLKAKKAGVTVLAYGCKITPGTLVLDKLIPIIL